MEKDDWEILLGVLGFFITAIGATYAICEYHKAQKWKRSEFLAQEIKEFNNDFNVKRALLMLDWNEFKIPLGEGELTENGKNYFYFNDEILESALIYHENKYHPQTGEKGIFTEEEALIRLIFDAFLEKLTTFQHHIEQGLFTAENLKPYLIYYLKIMGDCRNDRKKARTRTIIQQFIRKYEYNPVKRLLESYGYYIPLEPPKWQKGQD